MNIAIDLDNTLFHNNIVEDVISELKMDITSYKWDLEELGKEGKDECYKRFKNPSFMCNLKAIKGCKEKIEEWSKNHTLFCITSRHKSLMENTLKMIRSCYPSIENIVIVGGFNKLNSFISQNIDVVIDDSPHSVSDALKVDKIKQIYYISNSKTVYNHNFNFENDRVTKVEGLKDIIL
jgi:uncharacterized HAD superfamily protein